MFYDHQNGMMENSDEHSTQESTPLWLNRSLIVAFLLCLIAFLTALWLSNTLIYIPDQWSSTPLIQFLITYRVPVLLLLAASVLTCHLALRFLTREILGVPERFLDERQKIARDQAHRSAFKFVHVSFLLIPAVLVLKYLPSWLAPKIPLSVMKVDYSLVYSTNLKDRSSFQRQTWYPYRVVL